MIDAKDLRIGNLITDGTHQILRVNTVYQKYVTVDGRVSCHYSDLIRGIELTHEILVAAGFVKRNAILYQNNILEYDFSVEFVFKGGSPISKVKFVHQLQNLYHALTGEDLKIELPTTGKERLLKE